MNYQLRLSRRTAAAACASAMISLPRLRAARAHAKYFTEGIQKYHHEYPRIFVEYHESSVWPIYIYIYIDLEALYN